MKSIFSLCQVEDHNVFKNWRIFIVSLITATTFVFAFFAFVGFVIWVVFLRGYLHVIYFPLPHPPYPPIKKSLDMTDAGPFVICDLKIIIPAKYDLDLRYKYHNIDVNSKEKDRINSLIKGGLSEVNFSNLSNKQVPHLWQVTILKASEDGSNELFRTRTVSPKIRGLGHWTNNQLDTFLTVFYLEKGRYKLIIEGLNMAMPFQGLETEINFYPRPWGVIY